MNKRWHLIYENLVNSLGYLVLKGKVREPQFDKTNKKNKEKHKQIQKQEHESLFNGILDNFPSK